MEALIFTLGACWLMIMSSAGIVLITKNVKYSKLAGVILITLTVVAISIMGWFYLE